jgi:hypothetical protein
MRRTTTAGFSSWTLAGKSNAKWAPFTIGDIHEYVWREHQRKIQHPSKKDSKRFKN